MARLVVDRGVILAPLAAAVGIAKSEQKEARPAETEAEASPESRVKSVLRALRPGEKFYWAVGSVKSGVVSLASAARGLYPVSEAPCLSTEDRKAIADLLWSSDPQVVALKKKMLAMPSCSQSEHQPSRPSQIFASVKSCVNCALSGKWFWYVTPDIKAAINLFSQQDLTWALEVTKRTVAQMNNPSAEVFCAVLSAFCQFNKDIINKTLNYEIVSISEMKLTPGHILQLVKWYVTGQQDFYRMFEKLCRDHVLPQVARYASASLTYAVPGNWRVASLGDAQVFQAASEAVGSRLSEANAVIARVKADVFVIITDRKVDVSVVKIVRDEGKGTVSAVATR